MISYSTNFMGPVTLRWYIEHNIPFKEDGVTPTIPYAGGRIDIYGTDSLYGEEIGLPIMRADHWNSFSTWLDNYKTIEVKTFEAILEAYYKAGHPIIVWADAHQMEE